MASEPPIIIKNNNDMRRQIIQLTSVVSMSKKLGKQTVILFKYQCVRGDAIKMMDDIMKAFEKFGPGKGFVPIRFFSGNAHDVDGHAGIGFTSHEFHTFMDDVYKRAEMNVSSAPAQSNAPSTD